MSRDNIHIYKLRGWLVGRRSIIREISPRHTSKLHPFPTLCLRQPSRTPPFRITKRSKLHSWKAVRSRCIVQASWPSCSELGWSTATTVPNSLRLAEGGAEEGTDGNVLDTPRCWARHLAQVRLSTVVRAGRKKSVYNGQARGDVLVNKRNVYRSRAMSRRHTCAPGREYAETLGLHPSKLRPCRNASAVFVTEKLLALWMDGGSETC
ncbi:hypothetical protein BC629DRAFT_1117701 [Irpex lacteus]|nr:hypothetical protein BC629DRAFT_1117701 [Irpex lacteus]